ncbi:MAG: non-hydrolyzing UDP-N-acetylglucosamine 2-epimerase [Flavobacteriales bacterium]
MNIITIIGARPQIIKAAAISRSVASRHGQVNETIVHTGQHYDHNMSQVFIDELGIAPPAINLNVGSGSHGKQTAAMLSGIEEILLDQKPHWLVIYGDTNSTLAAAVAASKIHIPIVHIEAGLRSFNKSMPEEVNRIVADHLSTLLFVPTQTGVENLKHEGFDTEFKGPYSADKPGVFLTGDLMYDNSLYYAEVAAQRSRILDDNELYKEKFVLATIHRDSNTDNPVHLNALIKTFIEITEEKGVELVLPLHPRTRKMMEVNLTSGNQQQLSQSKLIKLIPPASFLDMIMLEKNASIIMTDSGGVQKEAYFFKKPCIILRPETEWVELLHSGTAMIADADPEKIHSAFEKLSNATDLNFDPLYGDGKAAEKMLNIMVEQTAKS